MAGKSKTRLKLEADATKLGIAFDDETTGKALREAIDAAQGGGASQDQDALGALIVIGPKVGFWRAGREFTPEPQVILISDLAEGHREAIEDEPKLTVEFLPPE